MFSRFVKALLHEKAASGQTGAAFLAIQKNTERLRYIELKVVALRAEVFARFMHVVAVRAFQLILIVRGHMRVLGLHVLRLRDERLRGVALRALFDVGRIEFRGIALAVAHFAVHTAGHVLVGAELIGSGCRSGREESGAEGEN